MNAWKRLSSVSLFWILCLTGLAQTTARPDHAGPEQKATPSISDLKQRPPADHRISLDVVVTDKAGNPMPGLREQDFTLLDDTARKNRVV
jgi:hypothetical protein